MKYFSPAKINLGLKIPYKRSTDGYHQIESIFLRINWGDEMKIQTLDTDSESDFWLSTIYRLDKESESILRSVSEPHNWNKNLIYKTHELAKKINPSIPPLSIELTKTIPPGGGLGGGSSNSGTLWNYFISKGYMDAETATRSSLKLGADIPFFLLGQNAWVTGVGEILEPIEIASGYGVLLIPRISLSTKTMYINLKKSLQKPRLSKLWKEQEASTLLALETGNWASLQGVLENDFESVAFSEYPLLEEIRDRFLRFGADYSAMSGSGSTMYGITSTEDRRDSLLCNMQKNYPGYVLIPFSF